MRHRPCASWATCVAIAGILISCNGKEEKAYTTGVFGHETAASLYDLDGIQEAGELIAATLSGPETYYEHNGKEAGLQFELAEHFAVSIGVRLRMETMRDTAELLKSLNEGHIDLIALDIPAHKTSGMCQPATQDTTSGGSGWRVRKNTPLLAEALNRWYNPEIKASLQKRARQRLLPGGGVKRKVRAPLQNRSKGIISPYDAHFVRHGRAIGWDWRLLAALCYQESGFDPTAVSWAGACGLMQLMPATAAHLGLSADQIYNPEKNIGAATQYIRELEHKFSDIPGRTERINFVLAAYNGGTGHVRDAMALARKYGKNPHLWAETAPFILGLGQPHYYNDPVVRYGYLRGEETYGYVASIQSRWQFYRSAVKGNITGTQPAPARKHSHNGFKSKVLGPEELEARSKQEQNHP